MTGQDGIEPGFVLASRYEIAEKLGAGGMGVVYKAHDRLLNETVAIKVLRPEAAQTPEIAARFKSEIKLARAVSHRSVARIHEYGEDRGIRYISMAFVDGVDLKRVVRERGPLPPARALEIAIQLAEGLHAIHEEGIVHRDLKSSNVMMDGHGAVRLMDFGLAKLWSVDKPQDMTASGQIVGTPEYMSPEQILGRDLDLRSDIYSLAVVTYELITGRTPFRGDTPVATLMMHLSDPPPLEGPAFERVPASLIALLRRALRKRPEERFANALEFARALEQARAGWIAAPDDSVRTVTLTPTAIPPITVAVNRWTTVAPRPRRVGLGLISALAGVAFGGLVVFTVVHRGAFRATADPVKPPPSSAPNQAAAATPAPLLASPARLRTKPRPPRPIARTGLCRHRGPRHARWGSFQVRP